MSFTDKAFDAPACGFDNVFVTVERVRVHKSGSATDSDSGWSDVLLTSPQRVDLLTLTNGTLLALGQTVLPAGTSTQMRLVLSPNSAGSALANSIKPTGSPQTALSTLSGAQSGLKMKINIDVPADKVADFAIDFDACKSFVKAGNSGKYLLNPVLSVLPIVSNATIVGYVDAALATTGTTVSVQSNGVPVRATPPDTNGKFVLYPVPLGSYDLVITAAGRVNAVMTGVPVVSTAPTAIGSATARINTPTSINSYTLSGTITANTSLANTGGAVRATQALTGGPTIEVSYANADAVTGMYSLTLPAGAPARLAYAPGATSFTFVADAAGAGLYRLEASAAGFTAQVSDITLTANTALSFIFP